MRLDEVCGVSSLLLSRDLEVQPMRDELHSTVRAVMPTAISLKRSRVKENNGLCPKNEMPERAPVSEGRVLCSLAFLRGFGCTSHAGSDVKMAGQAHKDYCRVQGYGQARREWQRFHAVRTLDACPRIESTRPVLDS